MDVRIIEPQDCLAIAQIHAQAFPDSILTILGKKFYISSFLSIVAEHPDVIGYSILENSSVVGFAIYERSAGILLNALKAKKAEILKAIMANLFSCIKNYPVIVRQTSSYVRTLDKKIPPDTMEWFLGALDSNKTGRGLGKQSFNHTLMLAAKHFSAQNCTLTTCSDIARKFHESIGFEKIGEEVRSDQLYTVYLKAL